MRSWTRRQFVQTTAGFLATGLVGSGCRRKTTLDLVADPKQLIDLPEGFSYQVLSQHGMTMSDGYRVPGLSDGMAAFSTDDGRITLVRNHEIKPFEFHYQPFANEDQKAKLDSTLIYDRGEGHTPGLGGTTTLVFNPKAREVEAEYLSLIGTEVNCAGGITPWGTWISCEETSNRAGVGTDEDEKFRLAQAIREKDHGFNFEVDPKTKGLTAPKPLKAMGRFDHEAVAVDKTTGFVYQTEDRSDGLFYRFLPNKNDKLDQGGTLQALVLPDWSAQLTRNWAGETQFPTHTPFAVDWVTLTDPEAQEGELRHQGQKKNAAIFARLEGLCEQNGAFYFTCTTGGAKKNGQIFRFTPGHVANKAHDQLELVLESDHAEDLYHPDNISPTPWGDLFLCEDAGSRSSLVGMRPDGTLYPVAHVPYTQSELAGACFDARGEMLFVNIQYPGTTLVITGPWDALTTHS